MKILFIVILCLGFSQLSSQTTISVYFGHDSSELNTSARSRLDSLSVLPQKLTFRVFGNCDSTGTSAYNKTLSVKRADAVKNYIQQMMGGNISLGNAVGLGEDKPVNDNATEEKRAKNRRVDIFMEPFLGTGENIIRKTPPSFFSLQKAEIKAGDTLSLPGINFIGGRHVWLPSAEPSLVKLEKIMKENPSLIIEIQGHICCEYEDFDGEDLDLHTFNLSLTRAHSIKNYLENKGIKPTRITAKGLGHLNPLVYPERTEADRTKNRRVEVLVLKK